MKRAQAGGLGRQRRRRRRRRRAARSGCSRRSRRAAASAPARRARRGGAVRRAAASAGRGRRAGPRRRRDRCSRSSRSAIVDLPLPLAPTIATEVPGVDPQAEVVEHRHAALGGERHVLERRRRRAPPASACASGGLAHVERRVEQLEHAPPRHLGRGQRGVEPHQRLHRRHHPHLIGDERREGAERQRALDHARAAVQEHRRRAERHDEPGQAAGQVGEPLHAHQRVDEAVVQPRKRPRSRSCAFEVTTSVEACSVSIRKLPMSALRCRRSATRASSRRAVAHQRPQAERHHRRGEQRQPPVEPHQHHDAADQEQDVADPGQRRLGGHALDLADVAVDAATRCRPAACARRSAATAAAGARRRASRMSNRISADTRV